MIRKQLLIFLFFSLQSLFAFAQADSTYFIKGRIKAADSNEVLHLVNVFNFSTQEGTISDSKGEFLMELKEWPIHLQFSYIGYETRSLRLDKPGDHWLEIILYPYFETLPDIVVSAQPIIETITKSTYTVRDYVFVEDKLLLATSPGVKQGNSLLLIDKDGILLDSLSIKGIRRFDFLHRSCTGEIHLVTATKNYEIAIGSSCIQLVGLSSRQKFSRSVEPCVVATDSLLVYRYRYCIGQLLRFSAFHKYENREFLIAEVSNDDNLERRYGEELAPSIGYIDRMNVSWEEKEAELKRVLEGDMKLAGLINLFYQPVDVPVFSVGQKFCLFNHVTGYLQFYNFKGQKTNSIPVNYQLEKKWDGEILFDHIDQKAYTYFNHPEGKLLRQINMRDGTLAAGILINCALVEQIKVNGGNLYYLESGARTDDYNRVLRKVKL